MPRFNSTLVRLEAGHSQPCPEKAGTTTHCRFDWKLATASLEAANNASFNSTLVRLEDCKDHRFRWCIHVSIPLWFDWKVQTCAEGLSWICLFQFHFGSIGSHLLWSMSPLSITFQFHFGSIGSFNLLTRRALNLIVSIPLWFDWKSLT